MIFLAYFWNLPYFSADGEHKLDSSSGRILGRLRGKSKLLKIF